jgi:hypothetical protein
MRGDPLVTGSEPKRGAEKLLMREVGLVPRPSRSIRCASVSWAWNCAICGPRRGWSPFVAAIGAQKGHSPRPDVLRLADGHVAAVEQRRREGRRDEEQDGRDQQQGDD